MKLIVLVLSSSFFNNWKTCKYICLKRSDPKRKTKS